MKRAAAVVLAVFAASYSQVALSVVAPASWQAGVSATGQTIWFGPDYLIKSNAAMGQAIWDNAMDGVKVSTPVSVPVNKSVIPVVSKVRVPTAVAAVAIGKFAAKALPGITLGVALYDLLTELGFLVKKLPDGTTGLSVVENNNVYTTPCGAAGESATGSIAEVGAQCAANYQRMFRASYGLTSCIVTGLPGYSNTWQTTGSNCEGMSNYSRTASLVSTASREVFKTNQDFVDSIAAKSGWPTSSALARTLKDAIQADPALNVLSSPDSITGPASVSSPPEVSTTSSTAANGDSLTTTKTTTETSTNTYGQSASPSSGAPVNTVTSNTVTNTTTSVFNNTTNSTVSNTSTATNNPATADKLPETKEDACKTNPDRVGCMDSDTPEGKVLKATKTITYAEESIFGSGSCPANVTSNIRTLGKSVVVWDWEKTCAYALPLRAMILALASFAAFLIVMPGDTKV